jgi:hypothetical protein
VDIILSKKTSFDGIKLIWLFTRLNLFDTIEVEDVDVATEDECMSEL